jgi:dienelactone hydrolase
LSELFTPISLWKDFKADLPLNVTVLEEKSDGEYIYEHVIFDGRKIGDKRVKIYGVFAFKDGSSLPTECIYIIPDSKRTIDESLMRLYLEHDYCVFMVDYRGEWKDTERYSVYPDEVSYANAVKCGKRKNRCERLANQTCWYEWVALCLYGCQFIKQRHGGDCKIGLVGIRDGGEIAWKLATLYPFNGMAVVSAVGWKGYKGVPKFGNDELLMTEERYRFIAGIDSQSYAPFVKCPVILLCSTNDSRFDYDRAFDTLARINPEFADDSTISFSVQCNSYIGANSTRDMFMFFDKTIKGRQVFIPEASSVSITVDDKQDLVADVKVDERGRVEKVCLFFAEDCLDPFLREWTYGDLMSQTDYNYRFSLGAYEKTTKIFALSYVTYSNGFTAWSKITVKNIGGKFRNSKNKCRVIYSSREGVNGFCVSTNDGYTSGGTFLNNNDVLPQLVYKQDIQGIYSICGLTSYRITSPRYAPEQNSILKLDVFVDESAELVLTMFDVEAIKMYTVKLDIVGGVWQSIIIESKQFKSMQNVSLSDYKHSLRFGIYCKVPYAINNVMWL